MTPDRRLNQIEPILADVVQKVDRLIDSNGQILDVATRADTNSGIAARGVAELTVKVNQIADDQARLRDEVRQGFADINGEVNRVDGKVNLVNEKVDRVNEKVDRVNEKVDRVDEKVDRVDEKVDRVDEKVDRVDEKVDRVDEKVDRVDAKVDLVDAKVDRVDAKVDQVDGKVDSLRVEMNQRFDQLIALIEARL